MDAMGFLVAEGLMDAVGVTVVAVPSLVFLDVRYAVLRAIMPLPAVTDTPGMATLLTSPRLSPIAILPMTLPPIDLRTLVPLPT